MKRCPKCTEHPGWEHPEETGKRSVGDECRRCFGSGREQSNHTRRPEFRDPVEEMRLADLVMEFGALKARSYNPTGARDVQQKYHDRLGAVVTELRRLGALD